MSEDATPADHTEKDEEMKAAIGGAMSCLRYGWISERFGACAPNDYEKILYLAGIALASGPDAGSRGELIGRLIDLCWRREDEGKAWMASEVTKIQAMLAAMRDDDKKEPT